MGVVDRNNMCKYLSLNFQEIFCLPTARMALRWGEVCVWLWEEGWHGTGDLGHWLLERRSKIKGFVSLRRNVGRGGERWREKRKFVIIGVSWHHVLTIPVSGHIWMDGKAGPRVGTCQPQWAIMTVGGPKLSCSPWGHFAQSRYGEIRPRNLEPSHSCHWL